MILDAEIFQSSCRGSNEHDKETGLLKRNFKRKITKFYKTFNAIKCVVIRTQYNPIWHDD